MSITQEEFRTMLLEDNREAKEVALHEYLMRSDDIDYVLNFLNKKSGIQEAITALKTECSQYGLNIREIVDTYLDII